MSTQKPCCSAGHCSPASACFAFWFSQAVSQSSCLEGASTAFRHACSRESDNYRSISHTEISWLRSSPKSHHACRQRSHTFWLCGRRPPLTARPPRGRTAPSRSPASVLSTSGRCTFRGWAHCAICAAAIVVWLSGGASATTRTCSWEAAKALLQQPLLLLRRLRVGTGSSRCHPGLFPCRPMHECALLAHPSRPGSGCGWLRWAG